MTEPAGTILLVEDDADDIALFRRAVRKVGLPDEVAVAEDGEIAERLLLEAGPAAPAEPAVLPRVILLDLKMPKRSGLDFLAWLRRQPGLQRIPVVVFTSSREPSDISRAYELGANSYLVKPVSFDHLKDMVRTLHRYWIEWNEKPEPR